MVNSVFLTDANFRHALAAVRSLGQRSISVDVGSSSLQPLLCAFSKYVNTSYMYPNAVQAPEDFVKFLIRLCSRKKYSVLMPIGYETTLLLSKNRARFETITKIPVADFEKLIIAGYKDKTMHLAIKLGIPTPRTLKLNERKLGETRELEYPLVVKGITGSGLLYYVNNKKELKEKALIIKRIRGDMPIVQEYVKGEGYGFFSLYNNGKPKAIFMHKRLREYPFTGGPSTFAESVYDSKLKEYGLKILSALNWHGVAMVEFRKDVKDKNFKLMEINPKFWGSLDLAIASGVDFPYLLYKMSIEGDITSRNYYKTGLRFMWPFPDDFLRSLSNPIDYKNFLRDLMDKRVKKNILFDDLKPLAPQLIQTTMLSFSMLKKPFQLRYPQGMPIGVSQ